MKTPTYIDAAQNEKNTPLRYFGGIMLVLFVWLGIGSAATAFLFAPMAVLKGIPIDQWAEATTNPALLGPIPYYLILNIAFFFFFAGTWLAVRLFHNRSLRTVVTGQPAIDWKRIRLGFIVWFFMGFLGSLVEFLIWPGTFSISLKLSSLIPFLIFALVALIVTPIQTTSEELFFRGYLVQAGSLISRNAVFLSLFSGILFMIPHALNPEVASGFILVMLSYFVLGVFLAWISLKDGTIELAIGLHAANNLFAVLVVTYPSSALPTPAIFYTTHFNPIYNLVSELVLCALFYWIVFGQRRQKEDSAVILPE
jgi:membrane protease YdiL (CAAX protease family)